MSYTAVLSIVRKLLEEKSPNDYFHLLRVVRNVEMISKDEGGNLDILKIAALVHDLYRPWELKTGKSHFGSEALGKLDKLLIECSVKKDIRERVRYLVESHDIYDWSSREANKSLELRVLQDADNLDAIGAIGISRVFAFGGSYGVPIYIPNQNLTFEHDFAEGTGLKQTSIAHFYEKLLKISTNMNTDTGKRLAIDRNIFMHNFLDHYFKEYNL